jgi:hypothetical protein
MRCLVSVIQITELVENGGVADCYRVNYTEQTNQTYHSH